MISAHKAEERSDDKVGCERCGSRVLRGTSLPGVHGEVFVNGSPFWGLLAVTGEGRSVRRAECPDSGCKGSMPGLDPGGHFGTTGKEPTCRSSIAAHRSKVSGEMRRVFILHPLTASPSTGEDSEKARANLVYYSN